MKESIIPKSKKDWLTTVKNTLLVIAGTMVLSFGVGMFLIPFDLVTGGISGVGVLIHYALQSVPFLGTLSADVYISVLNTVFFFIGWLILGRSFAAKTLVSAIVYPIGLRIFTTLSSSDLFGGFFNLTSPMYAEYSEITVLLATVFSGACIGLGVSLTFRGGGSTGGIDILALTVTKYFKRIKSSTVLLCTDTVIIISGMFIIHNLALSLLGIISALVCSITIDKIFLGDRGALIAQVISEKHAEINEAIIRRLRRTTTAIGVVGGYSGKEKTMLTITFRMNQYAEFTAILNEIDKNAFVTVHRAHEINGEGWTYTIPEHTEWDERGERGEV